MTMQATMLSGAEQFAPTELPEPEPGANEVLVRVGAVSICGSDLTAYLGAHPRFKAPTVLGHELSGTVEALGAEVTGVDVGARVFVDSTIGCGTCRLCARDRKNICPDYRVMGQSLELPGGLAGLVAVSPENLHELAPHVTFEEAALTQPMSVAYHATIDQGSVQNGDTVLVIGAGAIGDGILLAAKSAGARVLIADTLDYRLELARDLGADVVINANEQDVLEVVRQETDGFGADVVLEAVGGGADELLRLGIEATGRGGRTVVVGLKLPEARLQLNQIKSREKVVVGSQAYTATTPGIVAAKIGDGSLPVERLITHRKTFDEIPEAFEILASRAQNVMKVVITA